MVMCTGAGKTHQAQKLMAPHGKQHGSCTLVHGGSATAGPAAGPARASPQQQQQHYLLLSLESVLKQMKVSNVCIASGSGMQHLPGSFCRCSKYQHMLLHFSTSVRQVQPLQGRLHLQQLL